MKYLLISTEPDNNPMPQIADWQGRIKPRDITPERAGSIPQQTLLNIANGANAVFSDILSAPYFMVSPMVYGTLQLYDPHIQYRQIVLFDKANKMTEPYHLPILPDCDCLLPESELSRDRSRIIHGAIDLEKTRRRPVIKLGGLTATQIAFRFDVVESIIRRGAKGIKLQELEIRKWEIP